jgi:formylmethanofuran dehydrogenase subunit C
METVTLTIKNQPGLYLEADTITPDAFAGKKAEEIAGLPVYVGRDEHKLGEFFEISGKAGATAAETKIVVKGDLSRVKYIGMKMTARSSSTATPICTSVPGCRAARSP